MVGCLYLFAGSRFSQFDCFPLVGQPNFSGGTRNNLCAVGMGQKIEIARRSKGGGLRNAIDVKEMNKK